MYVDMSLIGHLKLAISASQDCLLHFRVGYTSFTLVGFGSKFQSVPDHGFLVFDLFVLFYFIYDNVLFAFISRVAY
jgi:hypothetical protein